MRRSWGQLRKRIFGISDEEASFARRGFRGGDGAIRRHLEGIGRAFLHGYHAALEEGQPAALAARLDDLEPGFRGFAFEGAGMGLYLLDLLTPWNRGRLRVFLAGAGAAHVYMVHVGAGWALAQLDRQVDRALARFDPLLGWLAVDGYGFHQGYFHWPEAVERQQVPQRLSGYARRVFDQGLGRSLWFVEGAEAPRIAATIARFPQPRHADLWSGVGLACAYAGSVPGEAIEHMMGLAAAHHPDMAQGVAFAAKARQRAGNPAPHTERACRIVCGMPADKAAFVTDHALTNLVDEAGLPAYAVWRRRIRAHWVKEAVTS